MAEPQVFDQVDVAQDLERASAARTLVPSEREQASGAPERDRARTAETPEPRSTTSLPPRGPGWKGLVSLLSPRQVAGGGPLLPLILAGYASVVYQLDAQAFNLLLPEIRNDFGTGVFFLTALGTVLALAVSLAGPVMGFIADRARRTTMFAIGTVLAHLSIFLGGLATSIPALAGTRVVGSAGELVRGPVGYSLLTDYYPPRSRARVFTFLFIGSTAGSILGPVTAGFAGSAVGWRGTLMLFGGLATIFSLAFFLLREPVRGRLDRLAAGADEATASTEQRPIGWSEGWRAAWSVRTLRYIAYSYPFAIAAGTIVTALSSLYYSEHYHLTPISRGLVISIAYIPALGGLALSGPVADRLLAYKPGRLLTFLAGVIVLQALGLLVFVESPNVAIAVVANMVPALCGALIQPALLTALSLVVPPRIRGLGLQVLGPFAALGLPIPLILAVYAGSAGVAAALLWIVPILLVAAVIIAAGAGGFEADIRAALAAGLADEAARRARAEGRNKLLVCRGVDVTYDGAQVLFDVDFDVEEGELVALLGTNGAGKSTLLRAIAGIQQVSNGAVFLDGDDITHVPPHLIAKRGVVMMPGGQAIFPTLTVEQNLTAAAWMYRGERRLIEHQLNAVRERFPALVKKWHTLAGNLSGGEQQMVALSQALLMRPRLLMIDELSLGLAPQVVQTLLDTLREISRQGTTVLIVEQSINVALQLAERAVFMEKGEIRFDGSVSELRRRPDVVRSVFLAGAATSAGVARRRAISLDEEPDTVLEVDGLQLAYGGVQVLNGVSLRLNRGEVVGIVGPNGAGKSTLFDAIAGFATPSAGAITMLGRDITRLAPDQRARLGLGRSYQNVKLFPALTVRESIAVALERHVQSRSAALAAVWSPATRRSEQRVRRRVDNLVESLGLGAYADKFLHELSTGTRRIVDIACVFAAGPKVLLLDEPSSGLAQAETEMLAPVVDRIVKETGCAVLVIEHDLGLVTAVSDRMIALRLGEVMKEGSPAEVVGDPDVIEALLGGATDAVLSRSLKLNREEQAQEA